MSRTTQGLLLALLGAMLVRIAVTGEYLRFVAPWTRWPLAVTGVILVLLAIRPLLWRSPERSDPVPWATWLLLVPTLVVFVVAPPPLGAYVAERRAAQPPPPPEPVFAPLDTHLDPVPVELEEFVWRAQSRKGETLEGHRVELVGFVSGRSSEAWHLTRLTIACCAADELVVRVRIAEPDGPPRDQWVRVVGTWVPGTGTSARAVPQIEVESVKRIATPKEVYG